MDRTDSIGAAEVTPAQRYWEGRWRDEKALNEALAKEVERLQRVIGDMVSERMKCSAQI